MADSTPHCYREDETEPPALRPVSGALESTGRTSISSNQRKRPLSPVDSHEMLASSHNEVTGSAGGPPRFKIRTANQQPPHGRLPAASSRCHLLELPAELREFIWIHAVTEWQPLAHESANSSTSKKFPMLHKRPIRLDRFNRPLPPAITTVSRQIRNETLPLYYGHNIFEFWRPLFFQDGWDWLLSTFGGWLLTLGKEKTKWLREIVLLYKHENELEYDIDLALFEAGFELPEDVITERCELSEYEQCYESMGLPKHFGKRRVYDRWDAGSGY